MKPETGEAESYRFSNSAYFYYTIEDDDDDDCSDIVESFDSDKIG